jgi:hypothetical protein
MDEIKWLINENCPRKKTSKTQTSKIKKQYCGMYDMSPRHLMGSSSVTK